MFKPEGTECKEEDEMTKKYQVTIVTFSGKQREVFVEAKKQVRCQNQSIPGSHG